MERVLGVHCTFRTEIRQKSTTCKIIEICQTKYISYFKIENLSIFNRIHLFKSINAYYGSILYIFGEFCGTDRERKQSIELFDGLNH